MSDRTWTVYLAGEIHSDWRQQIREGAEAEQLPVESTEPITDHPLSDECGVRILGPEEKPFWKDHKAAKINALRTRTLIEEADLVIVGFGGKFKQWNAAFDAGYAVAQDIPIITLHAPELPHALKEIDGAAHAVAQAPEQIVQLLKYVIQGNR
jgi:YtoQ family protein